MEKAVKTNLDPQITPVPSPGATGQAQIFADYKKGEKKIYTQIAPIIRSLNLKAGRA